MATSGDYQSWGPVSGEWVCTSNARAGTYTNLEYTVPVDWSLGAQSLKPVNTWSGQKRKKYGN